MKKPLPKYAEVAKAVLESTKAEGVLLIVVGGEIGSGVVLKMRDGLKPKVPTMLRLIADQMES